MARKQGLHGDEIDFENTWATIEAAFREIHTKNASKLSYEELYRHAYRIVLKKKGEDLYRNVHDFERKWLSSEVRVAIQQLLSPNLLVDVSSLGGTTANERRVAGEKFLKGLKQAWGDHQVCMSMLADVLMYMVSRPNAPCIWGMSDNGRSRTVYIALTTADRQYSTPPWFSSVMRYCDLPFPNTTRDNSSAS
jgi:hypothetical protein